jgi:hypothetical protein
MAELHTIWLIVVHYGYEAVIELFTDVGDHYITHIVLIWGVKAGVVHGTITVIQHVRVRRKTRATMTLPQD